MGAPSPGARGRETGRRKASAFRLLLVLALFILQGSAPASRLATAEAARVLRGLRLVEPRLGGGFSHAPCVPLGEKGRLLRRSQCSPRPEPGTWAASSLEALRARLEEGGGRSTSSTLRARAVLKVLLEPRLRSRPAGRLYLQGPLEELEALSRSDPRDASLLGDLAAVWYLRGVERDEPSDLLQALELVERSSALDPASAETRFNRALILDGLHLVFSARAAWEEVARRDPESGWAAEARARIAALDRESLPERWREAKLAIEAAALAGRRGEVERLVSVDLQSARRFVTEDLLGAWGDRYEAGGVAVAARELRIAEAVGRAIEARTGERSAAGSAAAVRRAIAEAEGASGLRRLDRLARGHRAYRDAQRHLEALRTGEALEGFEVARRLFAEAAGPLELWAASGEGRVLAYEGRLAEAESLFRTVIADRRASADPALRAWGEWGLGWVLGRQGRIAEAKGPVLSALRIYTSLRERENAAFVAVLSADHSTLLGRPEEAWALRLVALSGLREQPLSPRRHTLLMQATRAEETAARDWASLALQTENLEAVERQPNPTWKAEALWSRARAFLHLGRRAEGLDHLARARSVALEAEPGAPRDKLVADLLLAEGEALASRDPDLAFADFDAAIRSYRGLNASFDVTVATLLRAEAALAADRSSEAERGLEAAMADFEAMARKAGDSDARASYSESVQRAFDAMIDLQARDRHDPLAALEYLERAKQLADRAPAENGALRLGEGWRAAGGPPARGAVVAYAVLEDRLLVFAIARGSVTLEERKVRRSELAQLADAFVRETQRRARKTGRAEEAASLGALLLPRELARLDEGEPVTFVPDRELFRVPFAALVGRPGGPPLVAGHPVSVSLGLRRGAGGAPAGAILPSGFRVLLAGDPAAGPDGDSPLPPLPGADEEVRRAADLFGRDRALTLAGREATRERVLAKLGRRELFVFAGHSVSDPDLPSRSQLFLTPASPFDPGSLAAGDLEGKRLGKLRLVVLASCSSLGSRVSRSAGIAGIARPFAQSPGVVVLGTLWPIADRRSGDFLLDFYRNLDAGRDLGTALWLAQKKRLELEGTSGSSDWLAYQMISAHL